MTGGVNAIAPWIADKADEGKRSKGAGFGLAFATAQGVAVLLDPEAFVAELDGNGETAGGDGRAGGGGGEGGGRAHWRLFAGDRWLAGVVSPEEGGRGSAVGPALASGWGLLVAAPEPSVAPGEGNGAGSPVVAVAVLSLPADGTLEAKAAAFELKVNPDPKWRRGRVGGG